jgi:hypothetical protein
MDIVNGKDIMEHKYSKRRKLNVEKRSCPLFPRDIWYLILSFILQGEEWIHIKLVSKETKEYAENCFIPTETAVFWAYRNYKIDSLLYLLKDSRIVFVNNTVLNHICVDAIDQFLSGYKDLVDHLLQNDRINIYCGNYIIKKACKFGINSILPYVLLNPQIDPSANDNNAIREATVCGSTEIVKILL